VLYVEVQFSTSIRVSEASGVPRGRGEGRALGLFHRSFCAEWFVLANPRRKKFGSRSIAPIGRT